MKYFVTLLLISAPCAWGRLGDAGSAEYGGAGGTRYGGTGASGYGDTGAEAYEGETAPAVAPSPYVAPYGIRSAPGYGSGAAEAPYMFAAIPLNSPMPVVHVLSRAPLAPRGAPYAAPHSRRYADAPEHSRHYSEMTRGYAADYARPYSEMPREYAADYARPYSEMTRDYTPAGHHYAEPAAPARHFAEPPERHFAEPPETEYEPYGYGRAAAQYRHTRGAAEGSEELLYARPSTTGGYTYRRAPYADAAPPSAPAASAPHHKRAAPPAPHKESPYILKIHKYRITKNNLLF